MPSTAAVARRSQSGEKATEVIPPLWTSSVATGSPLAGFPNRPFRSAASGEYPTDRPRTPPSPDAVAPNELEIPTAHDDSAWES
jgi:hypothetical protein